MTTEELASLEKISYDQAIKFLQTKLSDQINLAHFINQHDLSSNKALIYTIKNGKAIKQYPKLISQLLSIFSVEIKKIEKTVYFIPKN